MSNKIAIFFCSISIVLSCTSKSPARERAALCAYKKAFELMRDDRNLWLDEIYSITGQNYAEGAAETDHQVRLIIYGFENSCPEDQP